MAGKIIYMNERGNKSMWLKGDTDIFIFLSFARHLGRLIKIVTTLVVIFILGGNRVKDTLVLVIDRNAPRID